MKIYGNDLGLDSLGLNNLKNVHRNLSVLELVDDIVNNKEGLIGLRGAAMVDTGIYTGRSPQDKYIVDEPSSNEKLWWGPVNKKISEDIFDLLYGKITDYYNSTDHTKTYVFDGFAGADPNYSLNVRIIAKKAWQAHFVNNMFIRPKNGELDEFKPGFTIINASDVSNERFDEFGMNSETFIIFHMEKRIAIIGGTEYGGEMKKGIFSVLHYLLPQKGVLSMHCSANVQEDQKNAAIFFGLSGTGKTTLSTDPVRPLIGDDEHGWSNDGIFNFEGGCYAKVINLSEEGEPEIYATTHRFGTVLENVIFEPSTRLLHLSDKSLTENTRACYPLEFIENASSTGIADHPKNIVLLAADAFGVLPPISKLTPEQAMYHFLSGYTARVAGTEKGMGSQPEATFSTCFGGPFMPRRPTVYGQMLRDRLARHGGSCWLVNTGWSGGSVGDGAERMKIGYTRAMLRAALNGSLDAASLNSDNCFGLGIPDACPEVPPEILQPRKAWSDPKRYDSVANDLCGRFENNFQQFVDHVDKDVLAASISAS